MAHHHHLEVKKCKCFSCGKSYLRKYNFSLGKWARKFKCKCGCESFRWFNW